jgi:hypothetical protein
VKTRTTKGLAGLHEEAATPCGIIPTADEICRGILKALVTLEKREINERVFTFDYSGRRATGTRQGAIVGDG